ncbi:hypothetical protein [Hymenobacter weizhouensis]|uniref:hypothetical protein n=1 Tax=Hymenobacter sp. YIM 151500-1 TaxID=2987689 RepID=UPI002227E4B0|nr:hypothetical protein [Hymenobacter sp. YIM 151500-1]UYZ63673.1 hypothetical protein OIS53_02225 [Hymenobacter sp. YIM 151500-1]
MKKNSAVTPLTNLLAVCTLGFSLVACGLFPTETPRPDYPGRGGAGRDTVRVPVPPRDTTRTPTPPRDTVRVPAPPRDTVRTPTPPRDTTRGPQTPPPGPRPDTTRHQ